MQMADVLTKFINLSTMSSFQNVISDCKKPWHTIDDVSNEKVLTGSLEIVNGFNDFFP